MVNQKVEENINSQSFRIVIAEDDERLGKLIQLNLKRRGFKTVLCETGEETLSKVQGKSNEILLLDYKLPDMTGEEIIVKLKEKYGKTPVFIIMTGFGDEKIAVKMMKMGAKNYIVKKARFVEVLGKYLNILIDDLARQNELERTKIELESSKQDFQLLFHTMSEGVVFQNSRGEITSVNSAAEKILGLSFDQMTGVTSMDPSWKAVDENYNELPGERHPAMVALRTGERVENFLQGIFNPQKNDYVWILVNSVPLFQNGDSKPNQVYSTFTDITERKKAEEEQRKSDERFRIAQEMSPDGFTILRPVRDDQNQVIDFTWIYENEAVAKMNGTDPQKVVGQRLLKLFPGHKGSKFFKAYKKVAETGKTITFEDKYVGETIKKVTWFRIVVVPMVENIAILNQDITKRKIIEENLKSTFNLSPSIIAKANLKTGFYTEANQAVTRILGYSIEEFTSMPFNEFIHADDIQTTTETVSEQLEGNKVQIFENRFLCKDGSYKWISWNATNANEEGVVLGIGSDVTERKKAEEKIEESEASLQDAQRIANIGNWFLDLQTGKVEMSNQLLNLIGVKDKNAASDVSNHKKYYDPNSWRKFQKALEKTRNTGEGYEIELEFSNKNTEYRYARARGEAVFDDNNKIIGLKGTLQDITEIKRAELELKNKNEELIKAKEDIEKSELRFRTMFSEAPLGIALINSLNGKIYEVNQKFADIAGRTKEEMSKIDWMSITHPDDVQKDSDNMALLNAGKIKGFNMQKRYIKPDGSYVWINLTVAPIFVGDKKEPRHLAMIEDITNQISYEKELIKAKEKAEESDRLKSAFLANMSHEIRTPMNGILGFTEMLKETNLSTEVKTQFINVIHKSGKRLLNTVTDIVDISKIEAGLIQVSKIKLDVNEELESMYSFFLPEAEEKGLELSLEQLLPENSRIILTDKTKFQSILTNLIRNAIKYTLKGSVKFGCRLKENQLEFYVKDTGIGVPLGRQQAIFDRFVQADIADTRVFEGSGLGLAISKAYVEMLGGQIGVESEENIGSTFWVLLPLLASENKKPETTNIAEVEGHEFNGKIRILIAEDDEVSYYYLLNALNKISNEFIHAKNGLQAVEVCRTKPDIDLILMDIKMPEMDGYAAVREIRKFNKEVPIIAQTAHALSGDKEMVMNAGFNDYISKPLDRKLLLQKINKLILTKNQ